MPNKNTLSVFISVFIIVALWVMAKPIAHEYVPADFFSDPFDKVYNGLNVLFTALAFIGVIFAMIQQSEQTKAARREEVERSIFEMFQTFTSLDFQKIKDAAFRSLLAAVQNKEYGEYLASRLFVVGQLPFPQNCEEALKRLDENKVGLNAESLIQADRADRLMLDNMLNFFAMLAQRSSSAEVIKHCDFAYDWWRPVLWLIAQLQFERREMDSQIKQYCKTRLISETLIALDKMYGHQAITCAEPAKVWKYLQAHPKLIAFQIDNNYFNKSTERLRTSNK